MTRQQRRRLARKRNLAKAIKLAGVIRKNEVEAKAKANLSQPYRGKRTPAGLVSSIYSGAANPMGFTKPNSYVKANAPDGCVMALAKEIR